MNIADITGTVQHRNFCERTSATDDRKATIAFSSEEPYERWWGIEILSHEKEAIDLTRLKNNAPLLLDHNQGEVLGVIENVSIDADKRGRAIVRFSKSAKADEVYQDVLDGIRLKASVGYSIKKMKLEETSDDGPDTYRVTEWEPFEISVVGIAADDSIGFGRSQKQTKKYRSYNDMNTDKNSSAAEKNRVSEILALGDAHKLPDLARSGIENDTPLDAFRNQILEKLAVVEPVANPPIEAELGVEMQRNLSETPFVDACVCQLPGQKSYNAGRAIEVSQELSRQVGKKPQGVFVPIQTRGLVVGTDTAGGHLVETSLLASDFITLLRNKTMCIQLGATVLDGLVGDVAIPRQTGAATGYWLAEDADVTLSQQAFDQVTLTPTTIAAGTAYSRRAMLQSSIHLESFVKDDLSSIIAQALDIAAINGSGASNQPEGILQTSGIGDVAGGTNGLAPAWDHIVALQAELADSNALGGKVGFLTNSQVISKLMTVEKVATTGQFIVEKMPGENSLTEIGGIKCGCSNNVPSNLDKGTSTGVCSAIIFGNFKDLLVGQWGIIDLLVDPYTGSKSGNIQITAFHDCDIAVRHPESFAAMQDALTT